MRDGVFVRGPEGWRPMTRLERIAEWVPFLPLLVFIGKAAIFVPTLIGWAVVMLAILILPRRYAEPAQERLTDVMDDILESIGWLPR